MTPLYRKPKHVKTRWISFENPTGGKGKGAMEGGGGKGHAFDSVPANRSRTIADIQGCGIIHRMWFTVGCRENPMLLRGIRIELFWDDAETPAVSVPFPDFFCSVFGEKKPFENALFVDPEGASFVCHIDMPFHKNARIVIANDNDTDVSLFFDINYSLLETHEPEIMYFHAHWHREAQTTLGRDFEILPKIYGEGRFLGCNVGMIANPDCVALSWFGEGEFKAYLDGDTTHPTLAGTGLEDYASTGWGLGEYTTQYAGCLMNRDGQQVSFYRFHIPDPIYFDEDCRITLQQLGGAGKKNLLEIEKKGASILPTGLHPSTGPIYMLEEKNREINWRSDEYADGMFITFYREDDVCATAYFYLTTPENNLPPIQDLAIRQQKVSTQSGKEGNEGLIE